MCSGYLLEERVDECVTEIYLSISVSINTVYANPNPHAYMDFCIISKLGCLYPAAPSV